MTSCQRGDAGERGEWEDEYIISRVLFINKYCRLGWAANAARARICMASEQDEGEEQVSVRGVEED